jgi:hypothetical protein
VNAPDDGWTNDEQALVDTLRGELAALRSEHAGAPPLDVLRAARAEALPPEVQAAAARHLDANPWDRALAEGLDTADAELTPADEDRLLEKIRARAAARREADATSPTVAAGVGQSAEASVDRSAGAGGAEAALPRGIASGESVGVSSIGPGADVDRSRAAVIDRGDRKVIRPASWWRAMPLGAIALPAAALLAIAIGWFVWRSVTPPAAVVPPDGAAPEATQASRLPTPTADPILPLDKADVILSARALAWRGDGPGGDYLAALKPGLDAYRAGDYARANELLTALEPRFPQAVEVPFYTGVSRLFLGDADGARTALLRAEPLATGALSAEVAWYLAIADLRGGRSAEARERLRVLCQGTGPRAVKACDASTRLSPAAPAR